MTTYPIDFVSRRPASETLTLGWRQSINKGEWTLTQQTVNSVGQWRLQFSWPRMTLARAQVVAGWIDNLNGQAGSFRYQPIGALKSTVSGIGLATTAYQWNDTLLANGFGLNAPTNLTVGQLFQLGNQLLRITSVNLIADGSGRATISFAPSLRRNFTAGTALNFVNPKGVFKLASSDGLGFTVTPDWVPEFGIVQALEDTSV